MEKRYCYLDIGTFDFLLAGKPLETVVAGKTYSRHVGETG